MAEIRSISGCYALMETKTESLAELERVFAFIEAEFLEAGTPLPAATEVVHA